MRLRTVEGVLLVGILIAVAARSFATEDLHLWDETGYLARGLDPGQFGVPRWEDSALYSEYYRALHLVVPNVLDLYFVGRSLSAVLVVLGVWLAARLVADAPRAMVAAAVMAMLPLTYVWPGVAGPAAFAVVVAVALLYRWPEPSMLALGAALLWIAAGFRPEFSWAATVCSIAAVAWPLYRRVRFGAAAVAGRTWLVVLALATVLPALLALRFGNPLGGSGRQWTAFTQHFALRNSEPGQDPWVAADAIAAEFFPGQSSVLGALTSNPLAFLEHVARNIALEPISFAGHSLGVEPGEYWTVTPGKLAAGLLLVGLVLSLWVNRQGAKKRLRSVASGAVRPPTVVATGLTVVVLVAVAVPQAVIYPRPHYMLVPLSLLLVAASVVMSRVADRRSQRWVPLLTSGVLFGVFVAQTGGLIAQRSAEAPAWERSFRMLAEDGRALRVLSVEYQFCVYLPSCEVVPVPAEGTANLADFVAAEDVTTVLRVPILMQSPWGRLAGAQEFYDDPTRLGFVPLFDGSPILTSVR